MTLRKLIEKYKKDNKKSVPGSEYRNVYKIRYNESKGEDELVCIDVVNFDELIQSHEQSVNINRILERYALGDESVLDKIQGFYGDVSDLSSNIADFYNTDLKARELFDGLPNDIKEIFGYDYRKLILEPERIKELYKSVDDAAIEKEMIEDDNTQH